MATLDLGTLNDDFDSKHFCCYLLSSQFQPIEPKAMASFTESTHFIAVPPPFLLLPHLLAELCPPPTRKQPGSCCAAVN